MLGFERWTQSDVYNTSGLAKRDHPTSCITGMEYERGLGQALLRNITPLLALQATPTPSPAQTQHSAGLVLPPSTLPKLAIWQFGCYEIQERKSEAPCRIRALRTGRTNP